VIHGAMIARTAQCANLRGLDTSLCAQAIQYFGEGVRAFCDDIAVSAMLKKAQELGFHTKIVSTELYDEVDASLHKILDTESHKDCFILAAGEPVLEVKKKGGSGGRNLYMGLRALKLGFVYFTNTYV
jgi:hypothetical protein